jgi:hypothetical protein
MRQLDASMQYRIEVQTGKSDWTRMDAEESAAWMAVMHTAERRSRVQRRDNRPPHNSLIYDIWWVEDLTGYQLNYVSRQWRIMRIVPTTADVTAAAAGAGAAAGTWRAAGSSDAWTAGHAEGWTSSQWQDDKW